MMRKMFNKYIKNKMVKEFIDNDGAMVDDGILN